MICVESSTTHHDFLRKLFPSDYLKVRPFDEITEMLLNDTCNVLAHERYYIQTVASLNDGIRDGKFVFGQSLLTKEPHATITRKDDFEFSDIVNWVIQTILYAKGQGLTKDLSLCQNYSDPTLYDVSDLNFTNAVYCVGNYGEIYDGDQNNLGINQMNNETFGMLYAIPFGKLDNDAIVSSSSASTLAKIRKEGSLNCGVAVPDNFEGNNVTGSGKLVGMGVEYCHTLAAAILNGDPKDVKFSIFLENDNSSFIALANGTIDVLVGGILVGGRVQRKFDFARSSSLVGIHFSTPYYYGARAASNDMTFYSIATREDDVIFVSFVNMLVLATIYAQENKIRRGQSLEMPLVPVFGSYLNWALRDAIAYIGSYDEINSKNFGSNVEAFRGRNTLNERLAVIQIRVCT
mmetsp:Transcript_13888/g.30279  ORF Transcript_13888/g.30279 Transcript_13888/m.30279 type:complete len:405 (+) Transcript_13888:949-2163(+)